MKKVFAERLRLLRGDQSQVVFAEKLGYLQPAYGRYETGRGLPSMEQLYNICSKLNVSADWLLGLSENYPSCGVSAVHSAVALHESTAHYGATTEDMSRLLNIIESQQRIIESQADALKRAIK